MNSSYEHFVTGADGIGSSAAHWSAKLGGKDVRARGQHELGQRRGASEDHSRIIRRSYHATDYDVADTVELFHLVNEQDFGATEARQPTMKSRSYANGGNLVPLEQEVIGRRYYDWYRASMNTGETL